MRAARPSDIDALVASTLGNALESEGIRLDRRIATRGVRAILKDPHKGRFFVAECGGKVVGSTYVTFEWSDWHAAWYWWIQSAFVAKAARGQGVWTALYEAVRVAASLAKKADMGPVRSIRLYVESHNELGLRAYRGHGMKHCDYEVFEQAV